MPEETYSAHYIAHKGLRRAVEQFLAAERAAVSEHIDELAKHGPYREKN
jgi:predicted N-acyltransferase